MINSNNDCFVVSKNNTVDDFPKICVFTEVYVDSMNYNNFKYLTKKFEDFMKSIENGDVICLEYPLFFRKNSTCGIKSFNVKLTNLRTNKFINSRSSDLHYFWENLHSFSIINNDF